MTGNSRLFEQIEVLSESESEQYSEESIINQFADAMADAGEGAFFRVELKERQGDNGRPIAYNDHCGRYYLSELGHFMDLVERIQSEFGHGKYLFTLYGGGNRGIIKKQVVCIAKSNETDTPKNQLQTAQTGNDLKELIANMLQAQQTQMQQFLQAMQPQQSRKEYFEELLMMKQFFTSDEKPSSRAGNPVKETLEMLRLMKDGGLMGNDNQENDGFGRLIDKAAPIFAAAMQGAPRPQQPPAAVRQGVPMRKRRPQQEAAPEATQGQKVTKINQNDEKADINMMKMILAHKINSLVRAASNEKDPYIFAESLCEEFGVTMALEYAAKSDSLAKICAINPSAAQYESWFLDLAEYIKAIGGQPSKFSDEFDDFSEVPPATDGIESDGTELPTDADTTGSSRNQSDSKANESASSPVESIASDSGISFKDNEKRA